MKLYKINSSMGISLVEGLKMRGDQELINEASKGIKFDGFLANMSVFELIAESLNSEEEQDMMTVTLREDEMAFKSKNKSPIIETRFILKKSFFLDFSFTNPQAEEAEQYFEFQIRASAFYKIIEVTKDLSFPNVLISFSDDLDALLFKFPIPDESLNKQQDFQPDIQNEAKPEQSKQIIMDKQIEVQVLDGELEQQNILHFHLDSQNEIITKNKKHHFYFPESYLMIIIPISILEQDIQPPIINPNHQYQISLIREGAIFHEMINFFQDLEDSTVIKMKFYQNSKKIKFKSLYETSSVNVKK